MLVVAAPAQASEYLTKREACRIAGLAVHREYSNVVPGSGHCYFPWRPSRTKLLVDIFYRDYAGTTWDTSVMVRETPYRFFWRIINDSRVGPNGDY